MAGPKRIVIVGGGLSGLSVLHALNRRFSAASGVAIILLEKAERPGGTMFSDLVDGRLFEGGPNGFLDSRVSTLDLIRELGLETELVMAERQAAQRFISVGGRLNAMPMSPAALLAFAPMKLSEKLRILAEPFLPRGGSADETTYEFGRRRLGEAFARYFLDPMVSGVFAGDARKLLLREAFPRIHEIEQLYGSLVRGMIRLKIERKSKARAGQPAGELRSLRQGMGQLIGALASRYKAQIRYQEPVTNITRSSGGRGYQVTSAAGAYQADALVISAPAYAAAGMIAGMDASLAGHLNAVSYAALAVAACVYPREAFKTLPQGFGYLVPSIEQREVLVVLIDSNIIPGRAPAGEVLLRAMIGGARYPEILNKSDEELLSAAVKDIDLSWGLRPAAKPAAQKVVRWPRAIPQYNVGYREIKQKILDGLAAQPGLYLAANYLGGISMNDCTKNAVDLAAKIVIG